MFNESCLDLELLVIDLEILCSQVRITFSGSGTAGGGLSFCALKVQMGHTSLLDHGIC